MRPGGAALRWLVVRLVTWLCLGLLCWGCERAVTPPPTLADGGKCSPWLQSGSRLFWSSGGIPDEKRGCLLVSRGEQVSRSVVMLNRDGQLLGWDGKAFSAEGPLRIPPPSEGESNKLQFWFYAPISRNPNYENLEQICGGLTPTSYRTCITAKKRTCLFALSFRPVVAGVASEQIEIPPVTDGLGATEAAHCRLFYPAQDTSEIRFSTFTPSACACKQAGDFKAAKALPLAADAQALVMTSDGKTLLVSASQKLHVFQRGAITDSFGKATHEVSLAQTGWRLKLSQRQRFVAVVMDTRVEVLDFAKLLVGEREVAFSVEAKAGVSTADAAFRTGGSPMIAVAFYEGKETDNVELWAFDLPLEKQGVRVGVLPFVSVQSVAFDRQGEFMLIGNSFSSVSGSIAPVARFSVVPLEGQGALTRFGEPRGFFTKQIGTTVTALAVSPTNEYLLVGTGPTLPSLRKLSKSLPKGDHGQIEIWPTGPLKDGGLLLQPNEAFAHKLYTQRIAFGLDGSLMATLGLAGADGTQQIHLWQAQAKYPYYQFATSLVAPTGAQDLTLGSACGELYTAALQSAALSSWQSCQ